MRGADRRAVGFCVCPRRRDFKIDALFASTVGSGASGARPARMRSSARHVSPRDRMQGGKGAERSGRWSLVIKGFAQRAKAEAFNRALAVWLYRLAAIVMFVAGVGYWIRLVGIDEGPLNRFDLMPLWWKIAAPALAVLYPVAGIGLWLTVGWGAVVWVLIALIEAVMHLGFPELFGPNLLWLGFHLWGLGMLAVIRVVGLYERRRLRGY